MAGFGYVNWQTPASTQQVVGGGGISTAEDAYYHHHYPYPPPRPGWEAHGSAYGIPLSPVPPLHGGGTCFKGAPVPERCKDEPRPVQHYIHGISKPPHGRPQEEQQQPCQLLTSTAREVKNTAKEACYRVADQLKDKAGKKALQHKGFFGSSLLFGNRDHGR